MYVAWVLNDRQLNYLFISLFKKQRKSQNSTLLTFVTGNNTGDRWIPPTKDKKKRKTFPCDDVI